MLTVSVIIVAKNAEDHLRKCLKKLSEQDYPRECMEILVIDGGSTDKSKEVTETYDAMFIEGGYPGNAEARRFVGYKLAKNELLLYLDADNYIPEKNWITQMVKPFEDEKVVAAYTLWYGNDGLSVLDQYYSMIGGNDPIVYYLGKQDRLPYGKLGLPSGAKLISETEGYYKVSFSADHLPVVGCNGFVTRKSYFDLLELSSPEEFFHIDVHVDLLRKKPDARYAIVKNSILHSAGQGIWRSAKKRVGYKLLHHNQLSVVRRYKVFNANSMQDRLLLALAIFFSITFIEPIVRSIIGFYRTRNTAWFIHPIMTFLMVFAYSLSIILNPFVTKRVAI